MIENAPMLGSDLGLAFAAWVKQSSKLAVDNANEET